MKITTNAREFSKSASETIFPFVSGNCKSGAFVPKGNIVELKATMERNLRWYKKVVEQKFQERSAGVSKTSRAPFNSFSKMRWHAACNIDFALRDLHLQCPWQGDA